MLLSALLAIAAPPTSCPPLDGFTKVVAARQARWIVAGEMHGTDEMPAMFANLVCLASRSEPIVVAVEQPEQDQAAIDTYLNSDGGSEAEAAFLKATMWRTGQPSSVHDGRSSQAMFRLFQTLWQQYKQGCVSRVMAFEPSLKYTKGVFRMPWLNDKPGDQGGFEKRMVFLLRTGNSRTSKMLALTRSAHSWRIAIDKFSNLQPMASFLPKNETLTLLLMSNGKGSAWNCLELLGSRL